MNKTEVGIVIDFPGAECLRDIGLEQEVRAVASHGHSMIHTRWCHSMAGEEYARLYSWGNDPRRKVRSSILGLRLGMSRAALRDQIIPTEVGRL